MKLLFPLLIASAVLAQQPGSGLNFYSVDKEIQLGDRLAAEMQRRTNAHPDERLEAIGARIAATAASSYQFRFYVYDAAEKPMEATALPGGPVFIAQNLVAADEPLTAAMLAHAMAHIILRHYTKLATRADLLQIGALASAQANQPANASSMPMGYLQFEQAFEREADYHALTLLRSAGYDPHALIEWIRNLPDLQNSSKAFSPYPSQKERIAAIEKAIAKQN
jgi:predicted Zn-dependent protease